MSSGSKSVRSEDELGEKWDRCIADSIVKTGKWKNREESTAIVVIPIGAHPAYTCPIDLAPCQTSSAVSIIALYELVLSY